MKFLTHLAIILIVITSATSCSETTYKFKLNTPKKTTLNKNETISFTQESGGIVDSIQLFVGNKKIAINDKSATINTSDLGIGKHLVTALVFVPKKVKKITSFIEVFPTTEPKLYGYKIVNEYPHDSKAFTQGLEFYNGFLYETTGRHGESWLRKVDYKTGKVLQQKDLDKQYFGEGMTIYNDKIYWLTWKFGKGFIYNLENFDEIGNFKYQKSIEGWGLTHNSEYLIKSDGTSKIWFLDPQTLEECYYIQAYTNKISLEKLNELEWVEGKIYANYWQKPLIAIINPSNGVIEGIVDLTNLSKKMFSEQELEEGDDVLNGIAYDSKNKRLFVTGKHWNKLYEIEIVKK